MWELETRILLNFLTFLLIIIQFVIYVSFSGFSLFMKVMPTMRFHRKTTWTKQWQHAMTQQPITPRTYQTAHQQRIPIPQQGTIQHHTKPCIQQHDQQHTEQWIIPNDVPNNIPYIICTTYKTPNNNQPAGLSDNLPKDLTNLSNNMTNRTACKAYNNQPLGATKSSSVKKLNDQSLSRGLLFSLLVFFSFFALAAFECTTRANFLFTGG